MASLEIGIPFLLTVRLSFLLAVRLSAVTGVQVVRSFSSLMMGIRPGWHLRVNGSPRCLVGSLPIKLNGLRGSVFRLDHRMVAGIREAVRIVPSCDRSPVGVAISQRLV